MCQRPDGYLLWCTLFPYFSHLLSSLGLAFQFGIAQSGIFSVNSAPKIFAGLKVIKLLMSSMVNDEQVGVNSLLIRKWVALVTKLQEHIIPLLHRREVDENEDETEQGKQTRARMSKQARADSKTKTKQESRRG
ncbi:hypothetical protein EV424DRAFT_1350319 [Suillus variegatus]|nr:hypothetical protein EV424DRAFT_1350319 [Suillus variegatus]